MMDHTHKRTRSLTEHRLVPVRIIISYSLAYQKKSEYTEDAGTSEVWNVNGQTHLKVSTAGCASGLWRRNHTSRCPLGHRPGPEDDRHKGALESLLCNRDGAGQPGHPEAEAEMRQKAGKKAGRWAAVLAGGRKWEESGKTGRRDGCTYQLDILGLPGPPSAERYLDDNNHTSLVDLGMKQSNRPAVCRNHCSAGNAPEV